MTLHRLTLPTLLSLASTTPLLAQAGATLGTAGGPAAVGAGKHAMLHFGDFDGDGKEDALAISPERRLRLLHNSGDGSFEDITEIARLGEVEGATLALWGDFNQDSQLDLFVGTNQGSCHLFQNDGGVFLDVTRACGIEASGYDRSAHWTDYDQDGLVDLHLMFDDQNVFYHALEGGTFEQVALPAVLMESAHVSAMAPLAVAPEGEGEAEPGAQGQSLSGGSADVGAGGASSNRVDLTPKSGTQSAMAPLPPPTISGICAQSLKDTSGGGCLKASSSAELGKLYPISSDLYVQDGTGRVGIGTTSPTSRLSVNGDADFDGKVSIGGDGPLPFSFFVEVESDQNYGLRVFNFSGNLVGAWYNENSNPGCKIRFAEASGAYWQTGMGDDGSFEFSNGPGGVSTPSLKITPAVSPNTGNVGIGIDDPLARLHMNGMIRMGAEDGTSQPPNQSFAYSGTLTRRIVSTVTTAGQVVARTRFMRVERDGTNGGMRLAWDGGSVANQAAYGTALTSTGTIIPIVINPGAPAAAGSQPLFTATNVVRLDLAFGNVFNTREHSEITLIRDTGDSWWMGSLVSTHDQ